MNPPLPLPLEIRIIPTTPEIILYRGSDGLWYDQDGVIWALMETDSMKDSNNLCGISEYGALAGNFKGNSACTSHDYAYSSPAYQRFHTRREADAKLYKDLRQNGVHPIVAKTMWAVARVLGIFFWEGSKK